LLKKTGPGIRYLVSLVLGAPNHFGAHLKAKTKKNRSNQDWDGVSPWFLLAQKPLDVPFLAQ